MVILSLICLLLSAICMAAITTVEHNWDLSVFKYEFRLVDYRLWKMFHPRWFSKTIFGCLWVMLTLVSVITAQNYGSFLLMGIIYLVVWSEVYYSCINNILLTKLTLK